MFVTPVPYTGAFFVLFCRNPRLPCLAQRHLMLKVRASVVGHKCVLSRCVTINSSPRLLASTQQGGSWTISP